MARHSGLQMSIVLVDAVKIEGFHSLPAQEPCSVKVRFEPSFQDVKRFMKGFSMGKHGSGNNVIPCQALFCYFGLFLLL